MNNWTFGVKIEPRDVWVGLFWDSRLDGFHVYVCPLPFIVFSVHRHRRLQDPETPRALAWMEEIQKVRDQYDEDPVVQALAVAGMRLVDELDKAEEELVELRLETGRSFVTHVRNPEEWFHLREPPSD